MKQAEANYREGSPIRSCGMCGHFQGNNYKCDVVDGQISPFGFCDEYERQDNPFRQGQQFDFG